MDGFITLKEAGFIVFYAVPMACGYAGIYYFNARLIRQWVELDEGAEKDARERAIQFFGWIIVFYSAILLLVTPILTFLAYNERLFEGFIAAIAVLWFLRYQIPQLLPPRVGVFFHHWDSRRKEYLESGLPADDLVVGEETFLLVRVLNLSLSTYEDCSCSVTLPKNFEILDWASHQASYADVDFAKPFSLQRQNNCAAFSSPSGSVSLQPGDSLFCPILVKTDTELSDGSAKVEVSSKSAWFHALLSPALTISPLAEDKAST